MIISASASGQILPIHSANISFVRVLFDYYFDMLGGVSLLVYLLLDDFVGKFVLMSFSPLNGSSLRIRNFIPPVCYF